MKRYYFQNARLYGESTTIDNPVIEIENGKVISVKESDGNITEQIDEKVVFSEPVRIVPGFIDIHIHGADGADIMDGTPGAVYTMKKALPEEGTTAFLATTITQSAEEKIKALESVRTVIEEQNPNSGAEVLGVHLEGPFISKKRAGAQPPQHIGPADIQLFRRFQEASGGNIKLVTMAPEEDKNGELVKELTGQKVIPSIGHSDASYEEVRTAVGRGVSHVTHLFNGMRGAHHRDIGVAGGALLHEELVTEMIVDGIHISAPMVKLAYKNKGPERIILITDAMRAKGLQEGKFALGGQTVHVEGDRAVLEDGTLAGSIIKMNEAIRNMMAFTECSFEEAVQMATINPARQLGIQDRKGSIKEGKDADFSIVTSDLEVVQTYIGGNKVFDRGE
ncbi:N-acetylglucosamine-6-phosphate deacetylase [Salipaludibacillus aurantiacus]|uniref:N-acetylglucosamine-6-phosphate deacetylase n=1 Tax=Salipaludibacillus aurantiacus TaxID=1601833 RepID=A0A1H9WSH4_9BACI|nr:N-acetylglucosamine-6-phosphate deacetylase [Salipaludibacillus aurantiacus]SES36719.1 N-acetylglucosamine-6-phosphate deacetylase [Salipaludibacillus aurantiacus]